jgi:predicted RNA-binding Zn ribbon-like protein
VLIQAHTFVPRDLVGGHAALDLVNTVTARDAVPIDRLDGFPRLLEWAALTGTFDPSALRVLKRRSTSEPRAAVRALDRTRALREALLEVLTVLVAGEAPTGRVLGGLEAHWKDALAHARLDASDGRVALRLTVEKSGLDYLTHELALRAVALLETLPIERTRICPGPRCGWVFLDQSKAGRRRWCDMATCGNAAKSRRHYMRLKDASRGP